MPKKRFEERPYDPISADLVRDATSVQPRCAMPQPVIALVSAKAPVPVAIPTEATITKRFVLSRSEDAELNAFLLRVQQAARTKVPLGLLVRAALSVVMEAEARICAAAARQTFRLPSTHDRLALGEFEEAWRLTLAQVLTNLR
jgi:hypothetical protein